MTDQSPAMEQAVRRLEERLKLGENAQATLIERVAKMVIKDGLVPPTLMQFHPEYDDLGGLSISYPRWDTSPSLVRIHRHALNQLATKVRLPMTYVNHLLTGNKDETIWMRELLAHNLNKLYHQGKFIERGGRPSAFLHRLVGNELRGFLSRSFNRHLASAPLLNAFVDACRAVDAKPFEAIATDTKLSLKCFRPYVFEPVPGEFIAVGIDWANSDFGAARLTVSQVVMRISTSTTATFSEDIAKVHLGSVIEESDIEMSDETAAKEVDTQASAIKDSVSQLLGDDKIRRMLKVIELAHEQEIDWTRLKGQLAKFLYQEELKTVESLLDTNAIVDLPPIGKTKDGKPLPSRWWASTVVSLMASKTDDEERKIDLQKEAGRLLGILLPDEEEKTSEN